MRNQIINAVHRRMASDKSLFFVIGDMGINLVEKIAQDFPDRFVNVGIAEQNMIGVCAGVANVGYRPVAYTISNFAVHRCLEQVRNDVGIHELPILLLGTSTGFDNSPLGPTHHIVDDWGALRSVPGIEIHCPGSVPYAEMIVDYLLDRRAPAYVRIPKGEYATPASVEPIVHLPGRESRVLLLTYGGLVQSCLKAQEKDPRLSVMVFNRLRPVDDAMVADVLRQYESLVVVEDHFPETGLYSTVCQILVRHALSPRLVSRAPTSYFLEVGAGQEYFWKRFGADPDSLVADAGALNGKPLARAMA